MNFLERRYMGPTPFRKRKEPKPLSKMERYLLASGIFAMAAVAFFCDTVIEPRFVDRTLAAEVPMTEAEICASLERYSNGAEFADYCSGI